MIAESLNQSQYAVNNYKPLAAYILRVAHAKGDPRDWGLDRDRQTEAVVWAKAINSSSDHLGWAIKETDLVQQMNRRVTVSKSYHYVVSFPAGEQPSRDVLENIEAVLSTAIGFRDHQRLLAVHRDTPHLHMHVAINRIHPQTFRCTGTSFDHLTLQRTAAQLEDFHDLTKDNHQPGSQARSTQPRKPFQPSWQVTPPPVLSPEHKIDFDTARRQASQARKQALDALRTKHQRYRKELTAWHKQRRQAAGTQRMSRSERKALNLSLREAVGNDQEARKQKEQWERDAVRQKFPLLTLEAFKARNTGRTSANEHKLGHTR